MKQVISTSSLKMTPSFRERQYQYLRHSLPIPMIPRLMDPNLTVRRSVLQAEQGLPFQHIVPDGFETGGWSFCAVSSSQQLW